MTTKIIPYGNGLWLASKQPMGSPELLVSNLGEVKTFDLTSDELPLSGSLDEFSIEEFLADESPEIQVAVDAQGAWVAEALYKGENTLTTLRLKAGLSQKELALRCGMAQPHISRYESGNTEPGVLAARKVAMALGVTLDELVDALQNTLQKVES